LWSSTHFFGCPVTNAGAVTGVGKQIASGGRTIFTS
jgi:hypothetical protein